MENNWIWLNSLKDETNLLMYFRREYIKKTADGIEINITSKTFYKLYVNGKYIARGPAPFDPVKPYFDKFTVNDKSRNVCIAVEVYAHGKNTPMVTEQNKGESGLNMEIKIGDKVYVSDESFKCIAAPDYFRGAGVELANRICKWGMYKETYNSNYETIGWKECGFDDGKWLSAERNEAANKDYGAAVERDIAYLNEYEIEKPVILGFEKNHGDVKIPRGKSFPVKFDTSFPGSFPTVTYDFGREVVGYIEYDIEGEKDSSMTFSYGECLDLMRIDNIVLRGGKQRFSPFNRRAFRYVKITANGGDIPAVLHNIIFVMTHYPLESVKKFDFDNAALQKIFDIN